MGAAVQMQQLAEAGAGFAPAPVPAALPALPHEPGLLEGELDEAVGEGHGVVAAGKAVEVADVPPGEALAIEAQDTLHLGRRGFAARGAQAAAVIERDAAPGIVARPPPPHAARIEVEDVGGLQPRDRPTRMMTSWIFMARSTAAAANTMGTSLAAHGCTRAYLKSGHFICSRERTDHVLPTAPTTRLMSAMRRHSMPLSQAGAGSARGSP